MRMVYTYLNEFFAGCAGGRTLHTSLCVCLKVITDLLKRLKWLKRGRCARDLRCVIMERVFFVNFQGCGNFDYYAMFIKWGCAYWKGIYEGELRFNIKQMVSEDFNMSFIADINQNQFESSLFIEAFNYEMFIVCFSGNYCFNNV